MFKKKEKDKKYISFTTVLMTVVGMVVGVGIFLRNDGLMKTTGSTIASMISWVIIGILAFMMAVSFIEIGSSTKGKSGNLSSWATKFLKPWMGRSAAIFLIFLIMPIYSIALSVIAVNFLFLSFGLFSTQIGGTLQETSLRLWLTILISFIFVFIFFASNVLSRKPGEQYIKIAGMLKFIPLIAIFLLGTIYAIVNTISLSGVDWGSHAHQTNSITDPVKNQSAKLTETGGMFIAIMMATPAVMFTMDGFIHAANLQDRVKNKKTYVKALVVGMLLVIGTYLLVATTSYAVGTPRLYIPNTTKGWTAFWHDYNNSKAFKALADILANFLKLPHGWTHQQFQTAISNSDLGHGWINFPGNGYGFGVQDVIKSIFGNVLPLIAILLLLIFISASGISNAYWYVGPKAGEVMAKENNLLFKIEGENEKGNPIVAGKFFALIAFTWFIVLWVIEIIFFYTNIDPKIKTTDIFDASTDALVVEMFFMYALIILGGVINRWKMAKGKPHVKVEKNKYFLWTAFPSILVAFVAPIVGIYGHFREGNLVAWLIVIYFIIWIILSGLHEWYWRMNNCKNEQEIINKIRKHSKIELQENIEIIKNKNTNLKPSGFK